MRVRDRAVVFLIDFAFIAALIKSGCAAIHARNIVLAESGVMDFARFHVAISDPCNYLYVDISRIECAQKSGRDLISVLDERIASPYEKMDGRNRGLTGKQYAVSPRKGFFLFRRNIIFVHDGSAGRFLDKGWSLPAVLKSTNGRWGLTDRKSANLNPPSNPRPIRSDGVGVRLLSSLCKAIHGVSLRLHFVQSSLESFAITIQRFSSESVSPSNLRPLKDRKNRIYDQRKQAQTFKGKCEYLVPVLLCFGGWLLGCWGLYRLKWCNNRRRAAAGVAALVCGYLIASGAGIWFGLRYLMA